MSRHVRPENSNHPLRQLRVQLGKNGVPMSQRKFSQALGISASTIKAIENNKLELSQRVRDRATEVFGTYWYRNLSDKRWQCLCYPDDPVFKELSETMKTRPRDHDTHVCRLCSDLQDFLKEVPGSLWHRYFYRMQDFIADCRKELSEEKKKTPVVSLGPDEILAAKEILKNRIRSNQG